jgi:hypothetical protein
VTKFLLPAAIASLITLSTAHALPVAKAVDGAHASTPALTLVDDRRDGMRGDRDGDRRRFTPGRRYDNAPSGWHRYGRRPGNWRSRGCILVGPIWFCP